MYENGITLDVAKQKLALWLRADDAIAEAKSFTIGSRTLTRENAKEIREMIDYWQQQIQALESDGRTTARRGGIRVQGISPY